MPSSRWSRATTSAWWVIIGVNHPCPQPSLPLNRDTLVPTRIETPYRSKASAFANPTLGIPLTPQSQFKILAPILTLSILPYRPQLKSVKSCIRPRRS